MKSVFVALGIGIAIVIGSLAYTEHLENVSEQLLIYNRELTERLKQEDLKKAEESLDIIEGFLQERRTVLDSMGKHGNLDDIEKNMIELRSYIECDAIKEAMTKNKSLEYLIDDLPRNFHIRIENIL